jgi:hypothetical protein
VTQPNPLRRKALSCIREGRVSVRYCALGTKADLVTAVVRSSRDGHPYSVKYAAGEWRCTCREGRRELPCAHTLAVALVTTGSTT